jgi:hypothetical protein
MLGTSDGQKGECIYLPGFVLVCQCLSESEEPPIPKDNHDFTFYVSMYLYLYAYIYIERDKIERKKDRLDRLDRWIG